MSTRDTSSTPDGARPISNGVKYLEELNERQREAVLHADGPLLIVAGAGAGKTKTITHRMVHLMQNGVPGYALLGLTFTNKAAAEMRERVKKLAGEGRGLPLLTTFHALGVRLLREFAKDAGLPRQFVIWDRDDSIRALKSILEGAGLRALAPRYVLSKISRLKGDGVTLETFGEGSDWRGKDIAATWSAYEKRLRAEDALDFDDLLLRTLALLEKHPNILDLLNKRWTHITIDEYQDTNAVQYEIARKLAGEKKNLCVVGDIDQNIYSWRGADIAHLLSFERTFPGTKTVLLEQNYRSTRTILSAANAVIEKNTRRVPKNLFTENETGDPVLFFSGENELEEAWFIAATIEAQIAEGNRPTSIALLYRENFQSRTLEEALLHAGIPYRVLGTRFFERKEVKDVLSYIRGALNPKSTVDMTRIVATPSRGIGATTLRKLLAGEEAGLPPAMRAKIASFRDTLAKIAHAATTLSASDAVIYTLEASGLEAMFKKEGEEGIERLQNVRELVNLATRYDHMRSPEGIEALLEEAALASEQDSYDKDQGAVSLMTVHASKGLEFDTVFVTGLEQGLFPSIRDGGAGDERDSEEERRLFYVALTRARKRLYLTYAANRMKYGSREHTLPSEFLNDIDPRLMVRAEYRDTERVIR